ncbi:hypothetical protein KDA_46960 [Dictyobacter alpinus]|uniref:Uncharacterized protein n=1 Tax=Dictyobacter alpinus TaxID=2014873 RepID=A0A402BD57_9CHLR|nr:hypothetical protein KDA_46960 [Dictyobacter alpinus]
MEGAYLTGVIMGDQEGIGPWVADTIWENVNLAVVKWSQVKKLRDEYDALQGKLNGQVKDRAIRLDEHEKAVRANRQLALALQAQGLNEHATRFAYHAQRLQRRVFWLQMIQQRVKLRQRGQALSSWLFSWFLFLIAGYGYRPERSFLAYLFIIVFFTVFYHQLGPQLLWNEAFVISMTAFHGRGFFPSTFSPGDPLALASALEAFIGLIIEVTLIATITQRFFGK